MLSTILQSHHYNEKRDININEHIDNPPAFKQYGDTTFNKWQPKTKTYKAINIPKTSEESWDDIKPFQMINVPDSFVELGYSNIKPIERTDDLYYQYDLKNYDRKTDTIHKWQRETGELIDKESEMNANIVDHSEFLREYYKQWDNDIGDYTKQTKGKKLTPTQLHTAKQIRVEKATHELFDTNKKKVKMTNFKNIENYAEQKPYSVTPNMIIDKYNTHDKAHTYPYGILNKNLVANAQLNRKNNLLNSIKKPHTLKKHIPIVNPEPEAAGVEETKEQEQELKKEKPTQDPHPSDDEINKMTATSLKAYLQKYDKLSSSDKKTVKGQKAKLLTRVFVVKNKLNKIV